MNIAMIGAGRIGKMHAENIRRYFTDVTLLAVADPFIDEAWAKQLNIESVSKDPEGIFTDDRIDAVFICSSSDTHAKYIVEAAKQGKHIFCEKPIALTIDDAKLAVAAARDNGVKLQVGFNRRFDNDFLAMRQCVAEGGVGDVHTVKIISRDPEPPPLTYLKSASDIFADMTIHDFDMLRYLSGAEVESVYVNGRKLIEHEFDEPGYIDTAFINLNLSNGAIAIIENSRQAVFGYDQRAEVFGTKGAVRNDNKFPNSVVIDGADGQQKEKPLYFFIERYKESFVTELEYFFDAVKNNKQPLVTGEDALQASIIAKACRLSADENRLVRIDEI
jgi:myo-inositol 2-dehydrogenase / D-chiro-inositol 1-dehydrogenase